MVSSLDDVSLQPSGKETLKLPKKFGASEAKGSVVELQTNNPLGGQSFFLELFDKNGVAERNTKSTAKNFLKYVKNDLYDNSIFHRSVSDFVLQGGGFLAPVVSSAEGGMPVEIQDYGTVDNQPGNSNLLGTVAMAKIGDQPDSATNQWFVNLSDNTFLDEQNEGFTVFGRVLGSGMDVVDDLASADIFNAGGAFSQLPLWASPGDIVGVLPQDYLIVDSARKLSAKKQPFTLTVESSDENLLTASVTKKQRIKLKALPGASGEVEVNVRSMSLVDGSINEESFDVLIGFGPSTRQGEKKNRRKKIDILVDGGSFDDPFYRFFDVDGGELDGFKINVKKTYRFSRLEDAATHPFYLGDSGFNQASSKFLKIKGDGSFDEGIANSESFILKVRKKYRSDFKQVGNLEYFCTSHSTMIGSFSIKGSASSDPIDSPIQEAIVPLD